MLDTLKIGSINVQKKESGFTQIYNKPVQDDLNDFQAIGLLTYLMSLPSDWTIRKTYIQNKFTRSTFDSAWKKLLNKNYALDVSFYADGYKGKIYLYTASDERYTQEGFNDYIEEAYDHLLSKGYMINFDTLTIANNFDVPPFISIVGNQQHNLNSSNSTTTNKELKNKQELIKKTKPDTYTDTDQTKNEILVDSLKDQVPTSMFNIIKALSDDYKQAYDYIGLIYRAKADVEKKNNVMITLENNEHLVSALNTAISKSVREIERTDNIKSPSSYMFTALINTLYDHLPAKKVNNSSSIFYNWLED